MRALRWRAAFAVVGVVLVLAWVVGSGRTSYVIQVDWSWARHTLEGARVDIDGDSVGVLQRYGRSQYVTGFEVEPGDHVVRIVHDDCEGVPEPVSLSSAGSRLSILMADLEDGFTCRVVLR